MKSLIYTAALALLVSCNTVDAQKVAEKAVEKHKQMKGMEKENLKELVQKFYDQLSNPNNVNAHALSQEYMADDWLSTPQPLGGPGRQGFLNTLAAFGGMIPDLNWAVQEMLVDGNRVIVRSIASGTPNSPEGHFFGAPTDGSKKFEIMTIDVHTVEDGKMVRSYHVEDWATAIQQVSNQE
ncbi:ester cyclase [Allomuricauda sp. d1]|uniref:ester cyclase n=1 Tax=Allomuricauda sp. d1 TaxID=3136725 RepID=UPI0031E06D97